MLDFLYQYAREGGVAKAARRLDFPAAGPVANSRPDDVSHQTFRHHHVRRVCEKFIIGSRPRVGQFDVVAHYGHMNICTVDVYRQRKDVNTIDGANEGRGLAVVKPAVVGQLPVKQHDFVFQINS